MLAQHCGREISAEISFQFTRSDLHQEHGPTSLLNLLAQRNAKSRLPQSAHQSPRPVAMLHKKSQSTSALSVILSARDQPPAPSHLPSGHYLPSLSEGESQQVASTPSRRTETRLRISHSRTKSDLASLASESRSTSNTPTRIRRRELPTVPRPAHPADDSQRSTPQPVRRREAVSSTEEDTSDASDLDLAKSRQSRVLGKEVAGRPNRTPLGTSREDIRSDQTRKTPGKDPSASERTRRENGFQDFTLDHCVIVVSTFSSSFDSGMRLIFRTYSVDVPSHIAQRALTSPAIYRARIRTNLSGCRSPRHQSSSNTL